MMNVGYKRVSTVDQNTSRQLADMDNLDRIFEDKVSGKNIQQRVQLNEMMSFVREGDHVYVHSMDRLGRNLEDLLHIVNTLNSKHVAIHFLKENIHFGSASPEEKYNDSLGKLILGIIGSIAEFERSLILERQREGIALAKMRHAYKGRKPIDSQRLQDIHSAVESGSSISAACQRGGISIATYYKYFPKKNQSSLPASSS